jgi:hypothetical protein
MTHAEWYVAIGEAIKERGRALAMAANWQEKARVAEARVQELSAQAPETETTEQAPEQVPTEQVQEQ